MSLGDLSRRQLREMMRVEDVREDGTRYTQLDSERRRKANRERSKRARVARRKNRS
jgi:hypothetical protein